MGQQRQRYPKLAPIVGTRCLTHTDLQTSLPGFHSAGLCPGDLRTVHFSGMGKGWTEPQSALLKTDVELLVHSAGRGTVPTK